MSTKPKSDLPNDDKIRDISPERFEHVVNRMLKTPPRPHKKVEKQKTVPKQPDTN